MPAQPTLAPVYRACELQRSSLARISGSRARACNRETSASSTSGSWPSVAEKRTFSLFSLRIPDKEVHAACGLSEDPQLYTPLLHCVTADSDLMVTDTAPKGGYSLALSTLPDTNCGEHSTCELRRTRLTPSSVSRVRAPARPPASSAAWR